MKKYSGRIIEESKKLRIIDDALFRLIGTRKEVCQEILRNLLDDDKLIVEDVVIQKTEVSLNRELILDTLCTLGAGSLCNVEMQKSNIFDDLKRVRFHASLLTANHTPKGTDFKDIPNVKIVYITEYDVLRNGQSVTHVSRCQSDNGIYKPINDGEDIIFAYARSRQCDKYTYMLNLLLNRDVFYDELYPALSEAVRHYKVSENGVSEMCESIENFAKEYAEEYAEEKIKEIIAEKDAILAEKDARIEE